MTDPFASRPVDSNAVDLAWARYITRDMSRFDAVLEMTLAGVLYGDAQVLLDAHQLPSISGALAVTA